MVKKHKWEIVSDKLHVFVKGLKKVIGNFFDALNFLV